MRETNLHAHTILNFRFTGNFRALEQVDIIQMLQVKTDIILSFEGQSIRALPKFKVRIDLCDLILIGLLRQSLSLVWSFTCGKISIVFR